VKIDENRSDVDSMEQKAYYLEQTGGKFSGTSSSRNSGYTVLVDSANKTLGN
jgi:hypothetical protein